MKRAALVALALLLPSAADAQPRQQQQRAAPAPADLAQQGSQNLSNCIGQGRDANLVRSCLDGQRAAIEPRMQAAVQAFYALQPSADRRTAAEGVQLAWAAFRDARCAFAGNNPQRGADAVIDLAACLLDFTVSRTMDVEAVIQATSQPPPPQQAPQRR